MKTFWVLLSLSGVLLATSTVEQIREDYRHELNYNCDPENPYLCGTMFNISRLLVQAMTNNQAVEMKLEGDHPVHMKLSKCGHPIIATLNPMDSEKVIFQGRWLEYLDDKSRLNGTSDGLLEMRIYSTELSTGNVTFSLVNVAAPRDPVEVSLRDIKSFKESNNVTFCVNQTRSPFVFEMSMGDVFPNYSNITFETHELQIIANLSSTAGFFIGKCGFTPMEITDIWMSNTTILKENLMKMLTWNQLRCSNDNDGDKLEIFLRSHGAIYGNFGFEIVKKRNSKHENIGSLDIVLGGPTENLETTTTKAEDVTEENSGDTFGIKGQVVFIVAGSVLISVAALAFFLKCAGTTKVFPANTSPIAMDELPNF